MNFLAELGIIIKRKAVVSPAKDTKLHEYITYIGERPQNKKDFFITNKSISEVIQNNNIPKGEMGNIGFTVISDKEKCVYLNYYPFGKHSESFMGKGIGLLLEMVLMRELMKLGYKNYEIKHRKNSKGRKEREKQLEKIYGSSFQEITETKPTIEQAYWARRRFIEKERRGNMPKPSIWIKAINKFRKSALIKKPR